LNELPDALSSGIAMDFLNLFVPSAEEFLEIAMNSFSLR